MSEQPLSPTRKFLQSCRALGPGLLMAGAAIGVSHVYQSTRAGASFGLQLLWLVLLVNICKYPFFEYGHRYAAATGENLLQGYRKLGRGFLYAFLLLNVFSAVISVSAVSIVTGVLAADFFGLGLNHVGWSAIIITICLLILLIGHYRWLDYTIKVIMALLFVATLTAFFSSWFVPEARAPGFEDPSPWSEASFFFIIALMGWMPGPVEISVWQSLWLQAARKSPHERCSMKEARFDFNFGYGSCIVLALIFVYLGSHVMYGSGEQFDTSAGGFATQFVRLYTERLGQWAAPVIGLAAFATMFSTTLTVIDGYSRSLSVGSLIALSRGNRLPRRWHWVSIVLIAGVGFSIIYFTQSGGLARLIDWVTIVSFLSAPVYAGLNFRLLTSRHTPEDCRPSPLMVLWSWLGMAFLLGFGIVYLYSR